MHLLFGKKVFPMNINNNIDVLFKSPVLQNNKIIFNIFIGSLVVSDHFRENSVHHCDFHLHWFLFFWKIKHVGSNIQNNRYFQSTVYMYKCCVNV